MFPAPIHVRDMRAVLKTGGAQCRKLSKSVAECGWPRSRWAVSRSGASSISASGAGAGVSPSGTAISRSGSLKLRAWGRPKPFRLTLGFVNAYVLIRGKEAAVVDTGTPNNASKIADIVRTAGLGWEAV